MKNTSLTKKRNKFIFFRHLTLGIVALFSTISSFSQHSINGQIFDENNSPMPWTIVTLNVTRHNSYGEEGIKYISTTDLEGKYMFKDLSPNQYTIHISYIGYKKITQKLSVENQNILLDFKMKRKDILIDEVTIQGSKIEASVPTSITNLSKKDIEKVNLGQDIPYVLSHTPSMVVSSDAGAGVGYTYMRIRGSDASRINVTINGIPFNDAESHGSYFVDMPDFASSLESVQVQRGAGTSTNGAGAFGASINLFTDFRNEKAYAEVNNSFGSFNTMKNTLKLGTGIINKHFSFDGRLSSIVSDGYIDRASSDLKSYFLSGQYVDGKNSLKFITFSGKEVTYQAWGGTPKDTLKTNRTYNPYTYENEVDDYKQTHYQLLYNREFSKKLFLNTGLHYTKGAGFYEQYKGGEDLADYGISLVYLPNDTVEESDLIRRKWLDNDYYGMIFSLIYNPNVKLKTTLGGGINRYDGDHYGEVIWARYASNSEIRKKYYENDGLKTDANLYSKTSYSFTSKFHSFLDLQVRKIDYSFLGYDNNLVNIQQDANYLFLNPKVGFSYTPNTTSKFYVLFAVANKEPNRGDLTESSPVSRPKQETLYDLEMGYKKSNKRFALSVNGYFMKYDNQLVATGELNDVGASVRTNIKDSYRAGIEFEGGVKITKGLDWKGNITLSENKLQSWTEYVDNWDTWGKDTVNYIESTLAFSPSIVASSIFEFNPYKQFDGSSFLNRLDNLTISFVSKYVGDQFLDNTENEDRKLDAYFVHDLRVNYSMKFKKIKEIVIFGTINNVFDHLYSANGWVYRYSSGGKFEHLDGYYPQAGRNILVGLNLKF